MQGTISVVTMVWFSICSLGRKEVIRRCQLASIYSSLTLYKGRCPMVSATSAFLSLRLSWIYRYYKNNHPPRIYSSCVSGFHVSSITFWFINILTRLNVKADTYISFLPAVKTSVAFKYKVCTSFYVMESPCLT